jgi:hypothetical protein
MSSTTPFVSAARRSPMLPRLLAMVVSALLVGGLLSAVGATAAHAAVVGTIEGRLVAPYGGSVANVEVSVSVDSADNVDWDYPDPVLTGSTGEFSVDLESLDLATAQDYRIELVYHSSALNGDTAATVAYDGTGALDHDFGDIVIVPWLYVGGHVQNVGGTRLPNIEASLYSTTYSDEFGEPMEIQNFDYASILSPVKTDAQGRFSVTNPAARSIASLFYKLRDPSGQYATVVVPNDPSVATVLPTAATGITVDVQDADSGAPLAKVRVSALLPVSDGLGRRLLSPMVIATATTTASGTVTLPGLDPGEEYVFLVENADATRSYGEYRTGPLQPEDFPDVVDLERGGVVTGTVVESLGALPLPGAAVEIGADAAWWRPQLTATTAKNGTYTIRDVVDDVDYKQKAKLGGSDAAYWGGGTRIGAADTFTVDSGETVVHDFSLVMSGWIEGSLTLPAGATKVEVSAYPVGQDTPALTVPVTGTGKRAFVLYDLPEGRYEIRFVASSKVTLNGETQFRPSASAWYGGSATRSGAVAIHVRPGRSVAGITAPALTGHSYFTASGTVTTAAGMPALSGWAANLVLERNVGGAWAEFREIGGIGMSVVFPELRTTSFSFASLPAGDYRIRTLDTGYSLSAGGDGEFDKASATFTITAAPVTGIALELTDLVGTVAGSVDGPVEDGWKLFFCSGDLIDAGVYEGLCAGADETVLVSDSDGSFSEPEIPSGEYRLERAEDPEGFVYTDVPDVSFEISHAQPDAVLDPIALDATILTGAITQGATPFVSEPEWSLAVSSGSAVGVVTGSSYEIRSITGGFEHLVFDETKSGPYPEARRCVLDLTLGGLEVAAGENTTRAADFGGMFCSDNPDAVPAAAWIGGTVVDEAGDPISGVWVSLVSSGDAPGLLTDVLPADSYQTVRTDARGEYRFFVPAGEYLVYANLRFEDGSTVYAADGGSSPRSSFDTSLDGGHRYTDAGYERRWWTAADVEGAATLGGASALTITATNERLGTGFDTLDIELDRPAVIGDHASILGTPRVNERLTAQVGGDWSPFPVGGFGYQWLRNGAPISKATASTYLLTASDLGKLISVRIASKQSSGQPIQTNTVTLPTRIEPDVFDLVPLYAIDGMPKVGSTMTARITDIWSPTATVTYQWQWSVDGTTWTAIPKATSSKYKIAAAYVGDRIRVVATGSRAGFARTTSESVDVTVLPAILPLTVAIGGNVEPLSTVDAVVTDAGIGGVRSYQWYLDGIAIPGATEHDYVVSHSDLARKLTVKVTQLSTGFSAVSATSAFVTPAYATSPDVDPYYAIDDGSPEVGETLELFDVAYVGPDIPVAYDFQWLMSTDGASSWTPIAGATKPRYTITPADASTTELSRMIGLRLTAHYAVGAPVTPDVFQGTPFVQPAVFEVPGYAVSGTAKVGQTVKAVVSSGAWTLAPTTLSYQWQSSDGGSWTDIPAAKSSSYKIAAGYLGDDLRVLVTAKKSGYADATVDSAPTAAVLPSAIPLELGQISAPDGYDPGLRTVTAVASDGGLGATLTYQWLLDKVAIPGATNVSYLMSHSDAGRLLTVKVTATLAGYPTVSKTAQEIRPTYQGPIPDGAGYAIDDGSPTVGEYLSLTALEPWDAGLLPYAYTYQWQYLKGATWTNISGATKPRYLVAPADAGRSIRVALTAKFYDEPISPPNQQLTIATTTAIDPALFTSQATYQLSGEATVGATVKVVGTGAWAPSATLAYRWESSADGSTWTTIPGATKSSYKLASTDAGLLVRAVVFGARPGYATTAVTTDHLANVALAQTVPAPTIVGAASSATLKVGVTATATGATPPGGVIASWQWYTVSSTGVRTAIPGADEQTFVPTAAEQGKKLAVLTLWERSGHADAWAFSATSKYAVALGAIVATGPFTLDGDPVFGETLTMTPGSVTPLDATLAVVWLVDGAPTDDTDLSFDLTAAHLGKTVAVRATVTAPGYAPFTTTLSAGVVAQD